MPPIAWALLGIGLLATVAVVLIRFLGRSELVDAGVLSDLAEWPRSALPFMIIGLDPDPVALNKATQWAIEYWNERVGLALFVLLGEVSMGETVPMIPVTLEPPKGARVEFTTNRDGKLSAHIQVDEDRLGDVPPAMRRRAMAHELGTLLRLAHDPSIRLSIMYPEVSPTDEPVVTAKDRALLRELYG